MKLNIIQLRVSYSERNFLFFNFELVIRNWNKKSLTFEVKFFIFLLRVSNSKCEFLFFNFELVTQK